MPQFVLYFAMSGDSKIISSPS